MRLGQAVLGSFLAWTALVLHHGLFAPAMLIAGQATMGLVFLLTGPRRRMVKHLLGYEIREHFVGWRTEIWPFQWRIAISWFSGYFIFQLFNPVLFAYQGPVVAGQMGMSLTIATSIGAVAMAWINTKASPFGTLVARGEIEQLDAIFFRTLWQSTALLVCGAAAFFVVLIVAGSHFPRLTARVLPPWAFALLLLTTVMSHVVFSEALYLRAHKQEPFFTQAITVAILLGSTTWLLGKYSGVGAVTIGYFSIGGIFGLLSGTYIFLTKRRQWHPQRLCAKISVSTESRVHE